MGVNIAQYASVFMVMIRAEAPGETVPANRLLKHPAQCNAEPRPLGGCQNQCYGV
jgi:hypothetical protein